MSRFRLSEPGIVGSTRLEQVNGLTIGVQVMGRPTADALNFVLVHGIGVSSRYWGPLAEELARHGVVYLLDMPGYGNSPNPHRDVSVSDHADVLAEFVAREGIVDPVLVGHSMGSQIVSDLAARFPLVSGRIVLLGPTLVPGQRTLVRSALRLAVDMLREPARANVIVLTDYLFRCRPPWYLAQLPHLLRDRMEDRMALIPARVLVVRGNMDRVVTRRWARMVAELAPSGRSAEVPGAHVIMFTAPVELAALIREHARR